MNGLEWVSLLCFSLGRNATWHIKKNTVECLELGSCMPFEEAVLGENADSLSHSKSCRTVQTKTILSYWKTLTTSKNISLKIKAFLFASD